METKVKTIYFKEFKEKWKNSKTWHDCTDLVARMSVAELEEIRDTIRNFQRFFDLNMKDKFLLDNLEAVIKARGGQQ